MLKVAIDAQMRFGTSEDYCIFIVDVKKGREKRTHDNLINSFADPTKKDLYGTKEAIGESEDFFPYAYSLIDLPNVK